MVNLIINTQYTLICCIEPYFLPFLSSSKKENHEQLKDILTNIRDSYIVGLIEMILVSTMTTLGFMVIGVKYAILLGIITGF
jgi:predicted PurR-regulated permease PerM